MIIAVDVVALHGLCALRQPREPGSEVRALMGADKLRELDGDALVRHECR